MAPAMEGSRCTEVRSRWGLTVYFNGFCDHGILISPKNLFQYEEDPPKQNYLLQGGPL